MSAGGGCTAAMFDGGCVSGSRGSGDGINSPVLDSGESLSKSLSSWGGGDSGSAVFNMAKQVVGLHFAGSPSSSIFNRIEHVLTALDIEVVTITI